MIASSPLVRPKRLWRGAARGACRTCAAPCLRQSAPGIGAALEQLAAIVDGILARELRATSAQIAQRAERERLAAIVRELVDHEFRRLAAQFVESQRRAYKDVLPC